MVFGQTLLSPEAIPSDSLAILNNEETRVTGNGGEKMPEREHPVLLHIKDAEAWLARAKSHYQKAAPVRGELDLSLAQAEVRYAWELSRRKRMAGKTGERIHPPVPLFRRLGRVMVTVVVFLGLVFSCGRFWRQVEGRRASAPTGLPCSGIPEVTGIKQPTAKTGAFFPATKETATRSKPPGLAQKNDGPRPSVPGEKVGVTATVPSPAGGEEGLPTGETVSSSSGEVVPVSEAEEIPSLREESRPTGFDLAELERVAREALRPDYQVREDKP